MTEDAFAGAVLSACQRYRYMLGRQLVGDLFGKGLGVTFIMLNPSTADALEDDPTIRRCVGFARTWGYQHLEVVNLFAWRSPYPRELKRAHVGGIDIVGVRNDASIKASLKRTQLTVAAWGRLTTPWMRERRSEVLRNIELDFYETPMVLGFTKCGEPRHPLMLRKDLKPTEWT